MNLYKRGNIWWCKFRVDNILYQYSCKTKDKNVAQEVAVALNADVIRKKFDIPQKYKKEYVFNEVWQEYNQADMSSPGQKENKFYSAIDKNASHINPQYKTAYRLSPFGYFIK